jgi:hypothetical protein
MKTPNIDLKQLKEQKDKNFRERLEFLEKYALWVKQTPNPEWSSSQKKIIDKNR